MPDLNQQIALLLSRGDKGIADATQRRLKRNLKAVYLKALRDIQFQMAMMFAKSQTGVLYSDLNKYKRLNNMMVQVSKTARELGIKTNAMIGKDLKYSYSEMYYHTGFGIETPTQAKLGFGLLQPKVVEAAVLNPLDNIKWQNRNKRWIIDMTQKIRNHTAEGILKGEGIQKISKNIRNTVQITANRSNLIAQTEVQRVTQAGRKKAITQAIRRGQKLGLQMEEFWISTLDGATRDSHQFMDGQVAKKGIYTFQTGAQTAMPSNSGIAAEDINCRCTTGTRIKDEESWRRDNITGKDIRYQKYPEWKAGLSPKTTFRPKYPPTKTIKPKVKKAPIKKSKLLSKKEWDKTYKSVIENDKFTKIRSDTTQFIASRQGGFKRGMETTGLTEQEARIVHAYTKGSVTNFGKSYSLYGELNKQLFAGKLTKYNRDLQKLLSHSIEKTKKSAMRIKVSKETPLRRAVNGVDDVMAKEIYEQSALGSSIDFPAFTSTTINDVSGQRLTFIIEKNRTGKLIEDVSQFKNEAEVLFGSNSKFKVIRKEAQQGNFKTPDSKRYFIYLEEL